MPYSAKRFVETKGGAATIAAKLKLAPLTVRMWSHRNRIPRRAWPDILREYPDLTLDKLLQSEKAPVRRPEKKASKPTRGPEGVAA